MAVNSVPVTSIIFPGTGFAKVADTDYSGTLRIQKGESATTICVRCIPVLSRWEIHLVQLINLPSLVSFTSSSHQ